jgi:hypothetical protein
MNGLKRPSRLISVDIMKGIGILGMLFSHAFFKGVWYTEGNAANVVGEHAPWIILIAAPLIIIGTWPGFFVLMTGLLNAYLTAKRLEKGRTMKQAVLPLYVSAVLFMLIHILMVVLLHDFRPDLHHRGQTSAGLFGNLIVLGEFGVSPGQWYVHTILSLLSFANIFFALLMSALFRNNAWKNIRMTGRRLVIAAIAVLGISAVISEPSYRLILHLVEEGGVLNHIFIFILQTFSGSQLDLFPLAAYGCIGMVVALFLLADPERKNFVPLSRFLKTGGSITLISGVILIVLKVITSDSGAVDAIFIYEPYPLHLAVFNMGLILFVLNLAMRIFEFIPVEKLKHLADRTLFLRAAGMLTLTLYVLEFPVRSLFTYLAHMIFGGSEDFITSFTSFSFDNFMLNPAAIALYMLCIMGFWCLLVFLLMKSSFKGSFEWMFTKVANLFRPQDKSMKSDMNRILYPFTHEKE